MHRIAGIASLFLFFVQVHPRDGLSTNVFDDLIGGVWVSGHHGCLAHGLEEGRVLQPRRYGIGDLGGFALVFPESAFQDNVDVAGFLSGKETENGKKTGGGKERGVVTCHG